jgi:hypothetical protein
VVLAIGYELGGAWLAEGNQNKLEANTATLQD